MVIYRGFDKAGEKKKAWGGSTRGSGPVFAEDGVSIPKETSGEGKGGVKGM